MNIFNLSRDWFYLYQQLEENGGELTNELQEQFAQLSNRSENALYELVKIIRNLELSLQNIDSEIERLLDRKNNFSKSKESIEKTILEIVKIQGRPNKSNNKVIQTDLYTFSEFKSESVEVIDIESVPNQYLRWKFGEVSANSIEERDRIQKFIGKIPKPEVNKAKAKKILSDNLHIDGLKLKETVTVKIK